MRNYFSRPYGIYVIAVWALVLGLQNIARLIYTLTVNNGALPTEVRAYQWVSVAFSVAFLGATVGLWQRKNWGRWLFLLAVPIFFIVATIGVFSANPADISPTARWGLAARYAVSIALPWVYLNLTFVKNAFIPSKEFITYD